jgi:hypothetical protein
MVQPYYRIARDFWREIGSALSEIAATPSDRVRIAARRENPRDRTWDEIA